MCCVRTVRCVRRTCWSGCGKPLSSTVRRNTCAATTAAKVSTAGCWQFIAKVVQQWLAENRIQTICIDSGSPWQNGFAERLPAPSGAVLHAACGRLLAPLESTAASATNASTASSSGRWPRPAWSSKTSGTATTSSARTANRATKAQPPLPNNSPHPRLRPASGLPAPGMDKPKTPTQTNKPTTRTNSPCGSKM